jgi:hypothetical protein
VYVGSVCEDCPRPLPREGKYTVARSQWNAHMPDGHFWPMAPALITYGTREGWSPSLGIIGKKGC